MIKSAIFDTKQVTMQTPQLVSFIIWLIVSVNVYSQYTETINTNRPGTSQGAFAVGKNVVQFETGLVFGSENHDIFNEKTNTSEFQYNIRVGLFKEQLELGLQGSYLSLNTEGFTRKGFPFNALGVKYLIYDPYKYKREESVNLLSWKANHKLISWKKLIPAVSAYAAASFSSSTGDLAFQNNPDNRATETQPNVTPRFVVSAHNVWSEKLVFVVNLVSNNLTSEFPEFRFITTATYNYDQYWSFFGEYEAISSNINKDNLLKVGAAFLLNPDLQFDARILGNFKNTPSVFNVAFGASYRLDYHKSGDNEYIDTEEDHEVKKYIELIKKDIESGHLDQSVLTGKLQSVIEDDVIIERFKGVDLEEFVKEEEEKEEEFGEEFEVIEDDEDTRIRWWQIGKRKRLRKKAIADTTSTKKLLPDSRRRDFLDEEFIQNKQKEITPSERTPEELAELELRREEEARKKNRKLFGRKDKALQVYVDRLTGDSIPPPDYEGMSRKERKLAQKKHRELFELDDDLNLDDFANSIEKEQNERDLIKERKRKEKEARKLAKRKAKQKAKGKSVSEVEEVLPEEETKKTQREVAKEVIPDEDKTERELDKELKKLEAQIAKEEERERKRIEKEAAKKAKQERKRKKDKEKSEEEN